MAISLDADAGSPAAFDGASGKFDVKPLDPEAPGYYKWGRLEYVGKFYLKFKDGPYWIKGGPDSPEDFLAYAGFANTTPTYHFKPHVSDWKSGDPDWDDGKGRGIIGALNYLSSVHANTIFLLTMNVGGDYKNVWPWAGEIDPEGNPDNDNLHFDLKKLSQWEIVFAHAQRKGIFLHFVFNEGEVPNKYELDGGKLGPERKLYYRELLARFGHHLALEWNLCEEYNLPFQNPALTKDTIRQFAGYVQAVDPYGHPITVHTSGDAFAELQFIFGDKRFSITSIQAVQQPVGPLVERFREATAKAGRPLPVAIDEFTVYQPGQEYSWTAMDNPQRHRMEKLWATYLSGGIIEFILEDELKKTESFKTPARAALWKYTWYARKFMEENLPFWEMEPADDLITGEAMLTVIENTSYSHRHDLLKHEIGAQVFTKPGVVYAVYLPVARSGAKIDLSAAKGAMTLRWYNPRTGEFDGTPRSVNGGGIVEIGSPPSQIGQDWTLLINPGFPR